ncbi:MAG: hypothetical protein V1708_03780 [Candidatus Micrarchaeota archaeon]
MNRAAFFATAALSLLCAGCLEAFETATPTPKKPSASPSALVSTATPIPAVPVLIPNATSTPRPTTPTPLPPRVSALYASRFGFSSANLGATGASDDYSLATDAGAHWDRPVIGPFNWQEIEYARGQYDFAKADAYLASASKAGFAVLGVVWPFNDWDQKACRPISCNAPEYAGLAKMRCKPCDMNAYKAFLKAMVLRYSNADTPVKYWEIASEPSAGPSGDFFKGSPKEYAELLNASYSAIKEVCSDCMVLSGGLAGAGQSQLDFFAQILDAGGAHYFDIASIHSVNDGADGNAAAMRAFLQSRNASKPVWVTQYSFGSGRYPPRKMPQYGNYFITDDEHASMVFKGIVAAFAAGAEKVFYSALRTAAGADPIRQSQSLVSESNAKRPAFAAYRLLASKLAHFSRAFSFSQGRYAFAIGNSTVYALWGAGSLPKGLPERVMVTDYLGKRTAMPLSSLIISDAPVLVEADASWG